MCRRISFYIHFRPGKLHLSKKSKSFYPSLHILVGGTRARSVMWSLHIYIVWSDMGTLLEYPAHLRRSRNFHLYARLILVSGIGISGNTWYMYYCIFRFICVLKMLIRDGVFCKRVHHKTALILISASLTRCLTLVIVFSQLHQDKSWNKSNFVCLEKAY